VFAGLAALALAAGLLTGCGGGGSGSSSSGTSSTEAPDTTTATAATPEDTTTLPPGATAGLDDYDGDGQPDPICSTQDFGAGLVLRVPCAVLNPNEPSQGTVLVPNSLFALPGTTLDLSGISGNAVTARDPNGKQVFVFIISSDTLFDVGSATLSGPAMDTFDGLARIIQSNWPAAPVQVRGHTDATGSASGNQTLSEQRAAAAVAYLATKGIDRSRLSSVGLGSTVPIALEKNPDGSDSPAGRTENRRVEFVVRVP
jgi:outer membrane protein OmpA-like peptidoglycan-associated protein